MPTPKLKYGVHRGGSCEASKVVLLCPRTRRVVNAANLTSLRYATLDTSGTRPPRVLGVVPGVLSENNALTGIQGNDGLI